jgi:acyl-CoA thioester hydrolase
MAPASSEHITHRSSVMQAECDHMGHMNVRHYVAKFDEATWVLFADIGLTPSYFKTSGMGMSALEMNIRYMAELLAGDVITVTSTLLEINDKVIIYNHTMTNAETGKVAATCHEVAVHIDRQARKSCPFPGHLKAQMQNAMTTSPIC